MTFNFCVIGGGIVGLATAAALLRRNPGAGLVLIEKETELGRHQTGRNSGVIHSGIYYAPDSLKARLCREGMARTKEFCREHNIPFEERGKLIVATTELEVTRLLALHERSKQNEIPVELLDAAAIAEREPNITGLKAIFVPSAAIVDYKRVMAAYVDEVRRAGGDIRFNTAPTAIRETASGVEIVCNGTEIHARHLIACAGLQSDRVARMAGLPVKHRIVPFRGEYFRLASRRNDVARAMIYPVPDPDLPFLGIHLTPIIDGSMTVGPNAVLSLAREVYDSRAASLRDVVDMASFPGFWRLLTRNLGPGIEELRNALFRRNYLLACRKYCPVLELDDLQPMQPGIRAQAVMPDGALLHDFLFLQTERMLHVCNAPSPAATSSLPIADMIVERLAKGAAA